ncbi:MAG TPA: nucleoid occlusion protein [Pseudobacteroides sp.]|nr:nucleoid occlusion protein [Pseudobacteroides sp.]
MLENRVQEERNLKKENIKNMCYIRIDSIRPNPYQPRKQFNLSSLEELCESIKQYGVIQPINVRKISSNTYELVSGERRLRAAMMAKLEEIPAIIVNIDDNDSAVIALIENLQREDLNYMEEAEGYNNLIKDHGFTQDELAQKIGKSQSTIANKIRLLKLGPLVKKILKDNNLTERHARALLKLHDEQMQMKVLKLVCEKGMNVKKTEELVERAIAKYANKSNNMSAGSNNNGKDAVHEKKFTKAIRDIRIFVNTIKQAIDLMKKSGVNAKAAQLDRGEYMEFIIRIPKGGNT